MPNKTTFLLIELEAFGGRNHTKCQGLFLLHQQIIYDARFSHALTSFFEAVMMQVNWRSE